MVRTVKYNASSINDVQRLEAALKRYATVSNDGTKLSVHEISAMRLRNVAYTLGLYLYGNKSELTLLQEKTNGSDQHVYDSSPANHVPDWYLRCVLGWNDPD